jgi:sarcosine oxidase subunit delta
MQLFPCPFCGPRIEGEFQFGAEAGKSRPEPASAISAERWANYLYINANPKGATREIWVHLTCGEFFTLDRDSVTHVVSGSRALREDQT